MRNLLRVTALLAAVIAVPGQAWAIGEIFKVEISGTEGCGDFDFSRFSSRNNVDLFVRVTSNARLDVSLSPLMTDIIPVVGQTYAVKNRKVVFSGSAPLGGGDFLALQGSASLDANGVVKKASGTFIQNGLIFDECFSSGKWKTAGRLN